MSAISGAEGLANNIPQSDVKNLKVPLPPLSVQRQVVADVSRTEELIKNAIEKSERKISLLKEKRSALITQLVTGQIDLSDWEPSDKQEVSQ